MEFEQIEVGELYLFASTSNNYVIVFVENIDTDNKAVLNGFDKAWLYFKDWRPIGKISVEPL